MGGGQQGSDYALLDGVQNMDLYYNLTAPFPNADATQEFRAITSNFGAEYGFSIKRSDQCQHQGGHECIPWRARSSFIETAGSTQRIGLAVRGIR